MAVKTCPVIFLAFANDRVDDSAYLRNLPKELDGIRKALYKAQAAGLCEVIERANATVEQLLNVFQDQRYRDRIAVFHYGGHANGYQLLLESVSGENIAANSGGLVAFFAKQHGLKLIFLNGCSSQQQALDLIDAGLPAVIGTSQSINDEIATSLAIRFYNGLGNGLGLEKAWLEAVDEVKIMRGTANTRDLFFDGVVREDDTVAITDRFPWEIHFKSGAEIVKTWNLPEQIGNPLFNLPSIPEKHNLPDSPFLFLRRYEREHARVFFGRSYYIRELYNKITDPKSPPIILLYGQTGVGKSSLFDAGILPRLEESHLIKYIRRDREQGLPEQLKKVLLEVVDQEFVDQVEMKSLDKVAKDNEEHRRLLNLIVSLEGELAVLQGEAKEKAEELVVSLKRQQALAEFEKELTDVANERLGEVKSIKHLSGVLRKWHEIERRFARPFVVILDQVEELFTQPLQSETGELDELLTLFAEIFSNPIDFPLGKLVLGYRKEYNPEIEEGFKRFSLPRTKVFLEHLDRKDIVDVFHGFALSDGLSSRYNLTIEENLPIVVADDLVEDKNSSVAPVLQILLTKMWVKAIEANADAPHFSIDLYQNLRREGILLADFYFQQIEQLRKWSAELEESGLALSVLNFHTTALGTAGSRRREELQKEYSHRKNEVLELVEKFKELYLLNEAGEHVTTLAHDTIAPFIQLQFQRSERPGQRASRVLANKVLELRSESELVLGTAELDVVEEGYGGMRVWRSEELELIRKSRAYKEKNQKTQRFLIKLAVIAVIFIILGFFYGIRESVKYKRIARQQVIASLGERSLVAAEVNPTLGLSMVRRYFQEVIDGKSSGDDAVNAFVVNKSGGDIRVQNAQAFLDKVMKIAAGKKLYSGVLTLENSSEFLAVDFSDKEEEVVTVDRSNEVIVWNVDGDLLRVLPKKSDPIKIALMQGDSITVVFNHEETQAYTEDEGYIMDEESLVERGVLWESDDGNCLIYRDKKDKLYNGLYCALGSVSFVNYERGIDRPIVFPDWVDIEEEVNICAPLEAHPDGTKVAFMVSIKRGAIDSKKWATGISIVDTELDTLVYFRQFHQEKSSVKFHPTKPMTGFLKKDTLYIYNQNYEEIRRFNVRFSYDKIIRWSFVPEKNQVAILDQVGNIQLFSLDGKPLQLLAEKSTTRKFGFSPSGRYCYKQGSNKVYIWDLEDESLNVPTWDKEGWLVKFENPRSPNAQVSAEGRLIADKLKNNKLSVSDWRSKTDVKALGLLKGRSHQGFTFHEKGWYAYIDQNEVHYRSDQYLVSTLLTDSIFALHMSRNGDLYAASANKVYQLNTVGAVVDSIALTQLKREFDIPIDATEMTMAIEENRLAVVRNVEKYALFEVYDLKNGKVLLSKDLSVEERKVTVSYDGRKIGVIENKAGLSSVQLWDTQDGIVIDGPTGLNLPHAHAARFSKDDQSLLIYTVEGVYSWPLLNLSIEGIDAVLSKPAIKKEVDMLIGSQSVVRGWDDRLAKNALFFLFLVATIFILFLNEVMAYVEDRKFVNAVTYGATFVTLMIFMVAAANGSVELGRMSFSDYLNNYFGMVVIPYVYYNHKWYKKLLTTAKVSSTIYLLLNIVGVIGALSYLYVNYDEFVAEKHWLVSLVLNGYIVVLFLLSNAVSKYWYTGSKVKFWAFAVIQSIVILFSIYFFLSI